MNIYVGNLAYAVTREDLQALFSQHGEVSSSSIITDRETGRSKGFGFVEMPQNNQAQTAMNALNGYDLKGRAITVNEARPKGDRPAPRGGGGNRW